MPAPDPPRDYSWNRQLLESVQKVLDKQEEIDRLEAEKEQLKEEMAESLITCLHETPFARIRRVGSDIYWMHPNFADFVKKIYKTATKKGLLPLPHPTSVACKQCGDLVTVESWTRYREVENDHLRDKRGGYLCLSCEQARIEAIEDQRSESREDYMKKYRAEQEAREQYFLRLQSMPYSEYIQTQRWQLIEQRAIEDAGYRCQVCNASGVLSARLRSPEFQGQEEEADIIVLCSQCAISVNLIQEVRDL